MSLYDPAPCTMTTHQETSRRMVVLQRQMQAAQALGLAASLPALQCCYLKVTLVAHLENGTSFSQDHLKHNTGALSARAEHSERPWGETAGDMEPSTARSASLRLSVLHTEAGR